MIPELEKALIELDRTVDILRQTSCDRWTAKLDELRTDVRRPDPYSQKEALFHIGELCHPKALGDASVAPLDSHVWEEQLKRLHDSCARAFNKMSK